MTTTLADTATTDHEVDQSLLTRFAKVALGVTELPTTDAVEDEPEHHPRIRRKRADREPSTPLAILNRPAVAVGKAVTITEQDREDAKLGPYHVHKFSASRWQVRDVLGVRSAVSSEEHAIQLCATFNRAESNN